MITNNVYSRVFQLKVGHSTGTIFVMEHEDRQYWVTAKHVISDWDREQPLDVMRSDGWWQIRLRLVGEHQSADVAVLAANFAVKVYEAEASMKNFAISQEVFFLGFPFGWSAHVPAHVNREFPLPFIKRAIVSAVCPAVAGEREMLILDGHNNPGFSGGPVVFEDKWQPGSGLRIAGVVSGYRFEPEDVFAGEKPIGAYVKANTGLMFCETIKRVHEVIEENPIGVPFV
ncbi:S1 family peptidase [Stenotrophomonas sepilia]